MLNFVILWLPAIAGFASRYFFGSRWVLLLAFIVLIPLISLCIIVFLIDPLTQSDPIRAAAYYVGAAISVVIGLIAGELLKEYAAK